MQKLTTNTPQLEAYLKSQGWLQAQEYIATIEKPGEGNMNFTLRVDTGERTFIIKQSRGYVEKYPQVEAPEKRALMEAEFYALTSKNTHLKGMMPNLIAVDTTNNVLQLEDLGSGKDYSFLYQKGKTIAEDELFQLMDYVAQLHNITAGAVENPISNPDMRALNHEHIFVYPYMENNGLDLDAILPGLASVGATFKKDTELQRKLKTLGELYLADGDHLLHGDYFPGSWLKTTQGIKIIDPEFCFFGPPEFEIGITIAHLKMADQPEKLVKSALKQYKKQAKLDENLKKQFTAAEILRRILGLAQLPLEIDLAKRKELVEEARNVILNT
ncbi:phosphotransferase [Flavimarina sp. Hel_I_48]|uniref:phosphotransferase n=1 Tax=Flavimarina sp. Hel_I_48 TaxID=1392488 RepID=UPI0004DF9AC8|nr:phosphotransferase [Flavimarina sp. Hel_I_48]